MRVFLSVSTLVVLVASSTPAQQAADLSGTWSATSEKPAGIEPAPSPVMGPLFGLRVAADAMTFERPVAGHTLTTTLKLDGSVTRTRVAGRQCEGDQEIVETAAWEDGALVFMRIGTVPAGGGEERKLSVRLLIRSGGADRLVVQGVMARRGGGEPMAVATVYQRTTDALPPPPVRIVESPAKGTIADVAWIAGVWSGVNGAVTVEERWTPVASGAMLATGRTLRATAQASFEFLCISERNGGLVYSAWPNARPTPTHFVATKIAADSVTFENPAHDFPQVVRYAKRADGSLETTISDSAGGRAQSFVLQRQP